MHARRASSHVFFGPLALQETIGTLEDSIRPYLNDPGMEFYLYTAPPKTVLDRTKTLAECRLAPMAVVRFGTFSSLSLPRPCPLPQTNQNKAASKANTSNNKTNPFPFFCFLLGVCPQASCNL